MTITYPRPKSRLGDFFWRQMIWFESTFVFSMLEPWEKILLLAISALFFVLLLTGLFKYLPAHVLVMQRRLIYYLWGQEGDGRFLWQRLGVPRQGSGVVGSLKEL